jgi:hypothetical protein
MQTVPKYDPHAAFNERIDRELREFFATEMADLERARERGVQRVERERKQLARSGGSPIYAPPEHRDRERAILEAAAAEFASVAERILETAASGRAQAEAELAKLEGDDGWERLSAEQRERAALRREFVREDVDLLPPHELPKRIRAALASNDKAEVWLYARYLGMRTDRDQQAGRRTPDELLTLNRELQAAVADPKLEEKKQRLLRKIETSKTLTGRVGMARSEVDGSNAAALAAFRERVRATF